MSDQPAAQAWRQEPHEALARIERFLWREQAAARRDHLATFALPAAERIARGRTLGPLRFAGATPDGDWRFALPADDSRFREGDACYLGPAATGEAIERGVPVQYVRFDQAARELRLRPDRQAHGRTPPADDLFLDAQHVDLTDLYLRVARQALGGSEVSDLVRALILGGPSRLDTARAALLGRLVRNVGALNGSQRRAFALLEATPVGLIQGPPGTGKTHVLGRMAAHVLAGGKRVVLCAVAHRAVNHALNACLEHAPRATVVKLGDPEQADGLDPAILRVEQSRAVPRPREGGVLIGTSLARVPGLAQAAGPFDVVLIDEAGQLTATQALCAAVAAPRALLYGDHRQLGPIRSAEPAAAPDSSGLDPGGSIFEQLAGHHPTEMLTVSYRLNRELARFPSLMYYDGRLRASTATAEARLSVRIADGDAPGPILDPAAPLVWVEVEHRLQAPPVREEAELAVACVAGALRAGLAPDGIGVISPYRAQNGAIRSRLRELASEGLDGADRVVVDTVERMQGQERDMTIVSLALSDPVAFESQAEFVYSPNRLNVAVTRARTKCIVLGAPAQREYLGGSAATLRGWTALARLRACARRVNARPRPGGGFELVVQGEPDPLLEGPTR